MTTTLETATHAPTVYYTPRWSQSTFEEERHEVFESVLQSVKAAEGDPDRLAACAYLLRHLARSSSR